MQIEIESSKYDSLDINIYDCETLVIYQLDESVNLTFDDIKNIYNIITDVENIYKRFKK